MRVKMFPVHITRKNSLNKVMSEETVEIIRRHEGAASAVSKDAGRYLASVLFRSKESQESFAEDCRNNGIDVKVDPQPAYVDSRQLGQ